MRQAITTQDEFNEKVKNSKGGVLLLFHSDNTAEERLQKYQDQAEDKCGPNYRVFTVNIDHIILSGEDISKYQHGKDVVCCTVLMNDVVKYKQLDPVPTDLWLKIEC